MTDCTCDSCLPGLLTKRYKDRATKRKLDKMTAAAMYDLDTSGQVNKVYGGLPGGASADELPPFASEYGIAKRGGPQPSGAEPDPFPHPYYKRAARAAERGSHWYAQAFAAVAGCDPDTIAKAIRTPAGPVTKAGKPGKRRKPVTKARKPGDEYAAFLKAAGAPATVRAAAVTRPASRDPEFAAYLRQIGRVLV